MESCNVMFLCEEIFSVFGVGNIGKTIKGKSLYCGDMGVDLCNSVVIKHSKVV